jgi:hypothetical protein
VINITNYSFLSKFSWHAVNDWNTLMQKKISNFKLMNNSDKIHNAAEIKILKIEFIKTNQCISLLITA